MNPSSPAAAPQVAQRASGLTRHLQACNAHDPSRYRPFFVGAAQAGLVRHDVAERLAARPDLLTVAPDAVRLAWDADDPAKAQAQAQARLDAACAHLAAGGGFRLRGERYALWPTELTIDRGAVSSFGTRAVGVHMNGFVRKPDGLHLWIGVRAYDKPVAPGQLDNLVAGGQPAGLSIRDNLIKEAAEEAAIPAALAAQALPVGMISYRMDVAQGLRDDLLYLYDLELPADFVPRNTDGEMERFDLYPVEAVLARIAAGDEAKFNVNLVLIDFFIRHGIIGPEHPDYVALALGLRRGR